MVYGSATLVRRRLIVDVEPSAADTDEEVARTGMLTIEQDTPFEMALPPGQHPIDITSENMGVMQIHIVSVQTLPPSVKFQVKT